MKFVLVTTTIYVPKVLSLYRRLQPDMPILVVGDRKTPHDETRAFVAGLGNAVYYSDEDQERLGYQCSPLIGWNKIMRRNIAILEAMRLRPDVVITIDDDNIPADDGYFEHFETIFRKPFHGLSLSTQEGAANIGAFLSPPVFHRGFPFDLRRSPLEPRMTPVSGVDVGIAAGLWAGDPDIDAVDRIVARPLVCHWSGLIERGLVISKDCVAPYNSQNTAFRAELAPLMLVWVGVGRYDDIWSAYAAQRIIADTPWRVHFGRPLVWQQRNAHNSWSDLRNEMLGMEHTSKLLQTFQDIDVGNGAPVERLRRLFEGIRSLDVIPPIAIETGLAWCNDVESVLV